MTKKWLLFAFVMISIMLKSQSVPTALEDWKTTLGTQNFFYKTVTKTDAFGNVYVAGATINGAGNTDILIAKYNASGVLLWIQQYAGAGNGTDFAAGLVVTDTYAILTGAVTTSTASIQTDAITIKYSAAGVLQWATAYAGAAGLNDAGKHIVLDGSGNVYITGGSYNSSFNSDFLTIKYNSSGAQQWASTYNYSSAMDDAAIKVVVSGTNLTVTGAVTSSTNNYKYATLTYAQSNGSLTATNISAAVTTTSVDVVTDLATDGSGNIYVIGNTNVSGQGKNFYVQKLSTTLVTAWTYTFNGTANLDDIAKGIAVDASGNVFVTGFTTSSTLAREITTIKLNSSGTQQWVKYSSFAGNDEANDLVLDASSNAYITGYKTNGATTNYYTVKYDASGTKQWEVECDDHGGNDTGTNITLDSLNNVIVTGQGEKGTAGTFEFVTVKYVQKDVITPTDFTGEETSQKYWYYKNQGQIRDIYDNQISGVLFYTDNTSPNIYMKKNSMSFVFSKIDTIASTVDTVQRVEMTLKGANAQTKTYALEQQDFAISYFMGLNRDYAGIHANRKLITPDIYPNIDLIYSSNGNGIKYYYVVKPGGNPADIQLQFDGLATYNLNATTNELSLTTNCGNMTFARPKVYQLSTTNNTLAVTGFTPAWQSNGATGAYKFGLGSYTSSLTLVIMIDRGTFTQPASAADNMKWNTYQGGNKDDFVKDLRLDRFGNIYTLTDTYSGTFYLAPTTSFGNPTTNNHGAQIMKYTRSGRSTSQVYIGTPTGGVNSSALTIVNDSNVVIVGSQAPSGLSGAVGGNPLGALSTTVGTGWIMKLNNRTDQIVWSTRYPGIIQDVDSKLNGDIYLCSQSYTNSALVWPQTGATNLSTPNSFYSELVAKFNVNGVPLWSSFVGVHPMPTPNGFSRIKVDTTKNEFYVFGLVNDPSLSWVGYNNYGTFMRNTTRGGQDSYIKKFNSADSMQVSTFIGGNKNDQLSDVTFLANGDICFAGYTTSTDTASIILNPYDGSYFNKRWDNSKDKGWILKFSSKLAWKYGTLYGDSAKITQFKSITTDPTYSNIMMAGYTEGMPGSAPGGFYYKNCESQGDAAFVAMDGSHHVSWSTAMGSPGLYDVVEAAAYNPKNQNWDFAGYTQSNSTYPVRSLFNSYNQATNSGLGFLEAVTGRFNIFVPVVSIKETATNFSNSDILLYPNPSQNFTNLYFNKPIDGKVKITLCNMVGQVMEVRTLNNIEANTTLIFSTSSLAEGMYFVNIQYEKLSQSIKFINFK